MRDKFVAALIYAIFATVLIFSWFRHGYLYGGGDVGIPSYDPQRIFNIARFIWWDEAAPGTAVPHGLTSVPFQFVQTTLHKLGFSYEQNQAIFFWLIIFLMGYGMFLVAQNAFGKDRLTLALLSGFLYELNPYMMVQVWHRFIHNTFFLAAALPFFFLFFRSWIKEGRYSSLLLFLLVNFIAVYLYGTIAFIVTILILLLFIGGFELLFPWKGFLRSREVVFRILLGTIAWLAIHSWWLWPVLNVSPAILSSQHTVVDNLSTLVSISAQTIIPYSLLGFNPYYLYQVADFGKIFDTYFFRFIPWFSLIFIVPGFLLALKSKKFVFWALLAVAGIILAKGATSPFGYPYVFGFNNFFPLGVLRNPFEKIGIYIPFTYAILIPLGIEWYLRIKRKKLKLFLKAVTASVLFLTLVVFSWPMWLGNMFGQIDNPAYIKIPGSYIKADEYIRSQKKTGRILHLPLTINESATYNWEYGYNGVESSQLYFNSLPSISRNINLGIADDALTALSYIFLLPNSDDKILTLLQAFNVRFIVLHKDMEWLGGYLPEPQKLELSLDELNFLERRHQFEDLVLYELKDEYFNPKIELTNNIQFYLPSEENIYWPWLLAHSNVDLISPIDTNATTNSIENIAGFIVSPEFLYSYYPEEVNKENLLGEMPAAKFLPDSPFYLLVRLKEKMQILLLPERDRFVFRITLAGKRLTESYLLKKKESSKSVIPQLQEYLRILPQLKEGVKLRTSGREGEKEISINFILSRHLALLNLIQEKASDKEKEIASGVVNELVRFMKEASVSPYYQISDGKVQQFQNQLISRFNLPIAGKYELLQAHEQLQDTYPSNLSKNTFRINHEVKELKGMVDGNLISYGLLDLPAGINEISFESVSSMNLAKLTDFSKKGNITELNEEIEITSGMHDSSYIDINIDPVRGGKYMLIFDSWIKLGDKFTVLLLQDTDPYDPTNPMKQSPPYVNEIPKDLYDNYWNSHYIKFNIKPVTSRATIRFMVSPWDDCKYFLSWEDCQNSNNKYPYEKISKASFKNIKVIRPLANPIFLRTATTAGIVKEPQAGEVRFTQKNAVFYSGKMNVNSPGFFIFNETFHPSWELKLTQFDGSVIFPSKKFLSNLYGNAWYIDNPGEYNFILEFTPQKKVKDGIIISMMVFGVIAIFVIRQRKGKDGAGIN